MKLKLLSILTFLPAIIIAQNISLKGNIVEAKYQEPLPGATVLIKGTAKGVTTDFDGNFEINTKIGDTLVASFLGMKTQEVLVLSSPITIRLEDDIDQLDEVIVSVGYFDVSKKDLSGSITQIKAEQLEQNRGASLENILQGQVAGVVVTESSEPGGGLGVSIRGTNSILGGTQPLYVLDGIPISPISDSQGNGNSGGAQSSMSFINPNDIEKIEVLKDAAATAVYGARGANGVILITSKSANRNNGKDKITLTVDSYLTSVRKKINLLEGPGFKA